MLRVFIAAALLAACTPYTPANDATEAAAFAPAPDIVPPALTREFRAAWVSPVWRPDWPSHAGMSPDSQRAELRTLLDGARAAGLNAVVLHVRMAGDALYPSRLVPWSGFLTGEIGKAPEPFYDPLQFAITEAHARGLALHAWFNPFRAAIAGSKLEPSADHVARQHPDWVVRYGTQRWINPGIPAARASVLAAIMEVVQKYDIDGVHLDDYFYPYLEERQVTRERRETIPFPDDAEFRRYGANYASRGDWRRANINEFVDSLYHAVKRVKPAVAVGISPFGIWKSGTPSGVSGLNAYSEIFADARLWLREGWLDYLAPQLYWPIDGDQSRFTRLDAWWRSENPEGRHIWPGLHTDRAVYGSNRWRADELSRQVDTLRATRRGTAEAQGHIHFRLRSLLTLAPELRAQYAVAALTPAMPWLDAREPAAPRVSSSGPQGANVLLHATAGDSVPVRWFAVQSLGEDGRWTLTLEPADAAHSHVFTPGTMPRAVAVRAISPTGVESAATVLIRAE